jgi:hypothetical protein
MSDMGDEILELSARRPRPGTWGRAGSPGRRYVRTPEGAEKYGLPIGSPITADAIARAKARGRSYTVPEDDSRFGSKEPVAGRQRRNASEIVTAIRNAPAPRVTTPDGPKKIAVGDKGFSFPEGSRAFRSQKHQNFAIVRTPDYQLVGITDRGIAFELDGDLERELNAELDDDLSEIWIPDEPNPNLGSADAPDGAEGADGPEVDAFRPDNLEDMPGYLSDERIDEILSGLEQAGVDQNARNATELQLRRNNDRIREEFESVEAPGGPDGTQEDAAPTPPPVPDKPADEAERIRSERAAERMETAPQPTPDRQPAPEAAETNSAPAKAASSRPAPRNIDPERARRVANRSLAAYAGTPIDSESENSATDDEQLATLEELTRSRPTGVAEGEVNGKRVAVRRNRVNDAMEYSAEDEAFPDRDSLLENTRKRNAPEEPRDTTDMEPGELSDQELDDVLADIDDALRAGMISRREARARRTALAAERNRRTGDAPDEPEEPAEPEVAEGAVQPGEPTTREWAEAAQPGAAAQTSDGVLAQRTDDGWETPLGRVQNDFLGESDVIDDDTVVVRNEPEADGRPVGATRQLTTIEDFEDVRPLDGVVYVDAQGNQITGVRRADGRFDLTLPDGLQIPRVIPEALLGGGDSSTAWHVPNQDFAGAQSRETWNVGDTLESLDDLAAQRNGTRLRYRFRRPGTNGRSESAYTVLPGGRVRHDDAGTVLPGTAIKPAILQGRVSVAEVPTRDIPDSEIDPPRVVENIGDYVNGDTISDYRHLRDMAPGTRVTLVVPASQNGGREAQVVLTRTRDEADLGGFMFLVGNGGRGYNSFGENNASLFQAIYEGRLHFGDIKQLPDAGPGRRIGGDWSRERDIDLWEGGPQVSEYDLRTFIASQVASTAMQGSYYDTSLLPDDSPFRSRQLRDEFSRRAIEQYSVEGNPARHKPAMIRLAAEKLGMQYTEPGSTLLPDNLTLEDFNTRVTLGRWLRSTGTSAEANMGPEQIEVTRADIKTALAVLDNMQVADSQGDPDKILKRVFARQGSPLQDLNVAVAIASYFRMKRFKDGQNRPMTTIARQYDKRRNRELLRQMLREQLEGREPGYYGVPEDEVYERNGVTYTNRSTLSRPQTNARNDENPNAVPESVPEATAPEAAPETEATVEPERSFPMDADRRAALDAMSWEDAWRDAQRNNDVLNYIEDVMGPEGVSALNDGTISMRAQFATAFEQANPDTYLTGRTPETPEVTSPTVGETVGADRLVDLPVGSVIDYNRRTDGRTSRYTRRSDGWVTERGSVVEPQSWTRATFQVVQAGEGSAPAPRETAETTAGDPRFAQGGAFTGSEIRQAPVGSHVRGASGREYRVTENGLEALGENGQFLEFPVVERFNANFTYVGDSAPDEPVSAVAQTAPDPRIGSTFDTAELLSLPRGTYVSSSGGTVWQLHGSYMTSTASGVRRRIRNLRSGRYRFLGNSPGVTPTRASGTPARPSRPIAEAGLSRVPQDVITRYDTPRAMPSVRFDTTDATPWVEMTTTPDGRERLNEGLRQALLGALPEGSEVSVAAGPGMFSASYTTPDGQQGSMSRTLHGNGRIENSVARAGGANFAAVQDHLFAFYRQHGLTEVEVHGLSSNNWNGAHTWIRRGFRPDPEREGANFMAFSRLRDNLSRIINRTEAGEFPAYVEFLDEAKDLARRMTELLNERQNLTIDERNERLYQLWRELTYLAEVRDASGATARGQRQSIGWRLLGNRSSETWYYGLRSLNDYFQN